MEKVSIIVPVYNVEKYLNCCIESIHGQTYSNIEIIVIDDGSKDNSGTICDEWARRDYRIKVIHTTNNGLAHARNLGLCEVSGEYIMFVDSDDWVDSNWVALQLDLIKKYNADVVYCGYYECYKNQKIPHDNTRKNELLFLRGEEAIKNLCLRKNLDVMVWMGIFSKKVWSKLKFPEGESGEDILPTYKIISNSNIIVVNPDILYYYRMRKSSIMHKGIKSTTPLVASQYLMDFVTNIYPHLLGFAAYDYINAFARVIRWTNALGGGDRELQKGTRKSYLYIYKRFNECSYKSKRKNKIFYDKISISVIRFAKDKKCCVS